MVCDRSLMSGSKYVFIVFDGSFGPGIGPNSTIFVSLSLSHLGRKTKASLLFKIEK